MGFWIDWVVEDWFVIMALVMVRRGELTLGVGISLGTLGVRC